MTRTHTHSQAHTGQRLTPHLLRHIWSQPAVTQDYCCAAVRSAATACVCVYLCISVCARKDSYLCEDTGSHATRAVSRHTALLAARDAALCESGGVLRTHEREQCPDYFKLQCRCVLLSGAYEPLSRGRCLRTSPCLRCIPCTRTRPRAHP